MVKRKPFKHINVLGFAPDEADFTAPELDSDKTDNDSNADKTNPNNTFENSKWKQSPDATKGDTDADMTKNEPIIKIKSDE